MKLGIVGLPNVGIVAVPDSRLDFLSDLYHPEKYTPAVLEFVDIAGLVKGASQGEGLGNKFLSHIREVDAIVHVIRCFEDDNIIHVDGNVNSLRDLETINLELIFSDIEMVERRIDRTKKAMKGDKTLASELAVFERLHAALSDGKSAREVELDESELEYLHDTPLLSMKPVIYVANVSEDEIESEPTSNRNYMALKEQAEREHSQIIAVCAQLEAEIAELDGEEKTMFLEDLGIAESGLDRLIKKSYALLGLISYLTAGPEEVRAWTIVKGTKAPQAAGKIHSDFERGFIRAEVVAFEDLEKLGSMNAVREAGLYRSEGKDYVMKDGDIVLYRFNV